MRNDRTVVRARGMLVALLILLAGPQPAWPQEKSPARVLLLDTVAGSEATGDDVSAAHDALAAALGAAGLEAITPAQAAREQQALRPTEVLEKLGKVAGFLRKGRDATLNLSLDEAIEAFQSALVLLRQEQRWLDDPGPLIAALMSQAEALAASGRTEEAKAAYHEVLVISPEYVPDPGQVQTKFRSLFDQVRTSANKEPGGELKVDSDPAGAVVEVDGLKAGETPLAKESISAGLHSVVLRREGYETNRKVVEVSDGETAAVNEALKPLVVLDQIRELDAALRNGSPDPVPLARSLREKARVKGVLLSQVARVEGKGEVLSAALILGEGAPARAGASLQGSVEVGTKTVAVKMAEAVAGGKAVAALPADLGLDFSKSLLGSPLARIADTNEKPGDGSATTPPDAFNPPGPGGPVAPTPFWKKWWFWTGAGAVLAAGLATTLALTLGPSTQTVHDPDLVHVQVIRNP